MPNPSSNLDSPPWAAVPPEHGPVNVLIRATGERAIRSLAFMRRSGMAGCGCDLSAEGKRTMNGFAIDFALEMPYPLAPPQGREVDF